jgi:hypothetical protein
MDQGVNALAVVSGELIAGGEFTAAGDNVSAYWARWGRVGRLGDWDDDMIVSLADHAVLPGCLSGVEGAQGFGSASAQCLCAFNTDGDADIDLRDLSAFQREFGR